MRTSSASPKQTNLQLSRALRRHVISNFYDESGTSPVGTAVYTLSDPRDIRAIRYVGQTRNPQRRFLQHLNSAHLWLPDELPWWIKSPALRPLYRWIRALYQDEHRLPTMVVLHWAASSKAARLLEREQVCEALARGIPLMNVESERQSSYLLDVTHR